MAKSTGLGRGFESLIPTQVVEKKYDATAKPDEGVIEVSVGQISTNPHQPRVHFGKEALNELAASIKKHGVIQPLVVQKKGSGYQLLAGERRLRASKIAKLKTVPVVVRSYSEQQQLEVAVIENVQREDLNPIEIATSYQKLIDQFNFTYEKVAKSVGKHVSTVKNTVRLLALSKKAKEALIASDISEGHARALLALKDTKIQDELLQLIVKEGLSVSQTEKLAKSLKAEDATLEKAKKETADETPLTKQIASWLKTPVRLKRMARGGRIVIDYKDDQDLERILSQIKR